jgi:hypothetical protein
LPVQEDSYSADGGFHGGDYDVNEDLSSPSSQLLAQDIRKQAAELRDSLVEWRRQLHRFPELMYQERQTSEYVRSVLEKLGVEHSTGWGKNTRQPPPPPPSFSLASSKSGSSSTSSPTGGSQNIRYIDGPGGYGLVADIGTGSDPCVLLRADMDALPVVEQTVGIDDFVSRNHGVMHACGHDAHTAMLLGAAAILKDMEGSIPGTVRVIFQPAEEGGAGGKRMREEGVLDLQPRPRHAFAMHVMPVLVPAGAVAGRPGPLLAAMDMFEITVEGVGGHAALPHLAVRRRKGETLRKSVDVPLDVTFAHSTVSHGCSLPHALAGRPDRGRLGHCDEPPNDRVSDHQPARVGGGERDRVQGGEQRVQRDTSDRGAAGDHPSFEHRDPSRPS